MYRLHNNRDFPLFRTTALTGVRPANRRGLTFIELMIASAVLGMLALAMSTLAYTVQRSAKDASGQALSVQHARVVLDRLERNLNTATASPQFPGFAVFSTTAGIWQLPETLVIWHPTGTAADPAGLPRFSELVVYCPNPANPAELAEITVPNDSRTVPALSNTTAWATELAAIKSSTTAVRSTLTDLLRTCDAGYGWQISGSGGSSQAMMSQYISQMYPSWQSVDLHGAVRFEVERRPTAAEWASYQAGTLAWENINWPQGRYGMKSGMGYSLCRVEIQLVPGADSRIDDPSGYKATPFLGGGVVMYTLGR